MRVVRRASSAAQGRWALSSPGPSLNTADPPCPPTGHPFFEFIRAFVSASCFQVEHRDVAGGKTKSPPSTDSARSTRVVSESQTCNNSNPSRSHTTSRRREGIAARPPPVSNFGSSSANLDLGRTPRWRSAAQSDWPKATGAVHNGVIASRPKCSPLAFVDSFRGGENAGGTVRGDRPRAFVVRR
jgi:hypothetical protein